MKARLILMLTSLLLILAGSALADAPGSSLGGNGALAFGPFEIHTRFNVEVGDTTVPEPVTSGYVVLLENAAGNSHDPKNWSDVLVFHNFTKPDGSGLPMVTHVTLISDSIETPTLFGIFQSDLNKAGFSPAVTVADINAAANTVYILEDATQPFTVYVAGGNTYHVYTDARLPGLGSIGLVLLTLLLAGSGAVMLSRRRRAQASGA